MKVREELLPYTIVLTICLSCSSDNIENLPPVKVDLSAETKVMKPFWNATGFSPAELLLNPEMQQVVKEAGELPDAGMALCGAGSFAK